MKNIKFSNNENELFILALDYDYKKKRKTVDILKVITNNGIQKEWEKK